MKNDQLAKAFLPSSTFTRDLGKTLDTIREQTLAIVHPVEGVHEMIDSLLDDAETHLMETKVDHYNSLLKLTDDLLDEHFTEAQQDALYALHTTDPTVLALYSKFNLEWCKNTAQQLRKSIQDMVAQKRADYDADHEDSP